MTMDDWNVFFTAIGILYLVATLICAVLTITGSNSGRVEKRSFLLALLAPIVVIVGLILIISSAIHYLRDVISDGGFILHYRKKKNKKKKREMYERVKAAYINGEIKREDLPRVEDGNETFEFKEEMGLAVDYYSKVREIVYIENGYCESLNRFFTEHRDLRLYNMYKFVYLPNFCEDLQNGGMLQYLYPDLSNDEKPSIDLKSDYPLSYLWHPEEAANIKTYFESNCEAIEVLIFKGNKTITIKCGLARNPSFNRLFRKIYEK